MGLFRPHSHDVVPSHHGQAQAPAPVPADDGVTSHDDHRRRQGEQGQGGRGGNSQVARNDDDDDDEHSQRRDRHPSGIIAPSTLYSGNDDDDNDDDDDDEEDEPDVEDLLWGAQMDLIGHRHPQAVAKLQQAVKQSSSAACATLGNLLARGLRGEHLSRSRSPTTSSPPSALASSPGSHHHSHATHPLYSAFHHSQTHSRPEPPPRGLSHSVPVVQNEDTLTAAQLFLDGLEIELDKPVEPVHATRPTSKLRNVHDDSWDGDVSEDESAEGRYFSLERVLDLSVGLTDSYRFGVVCPPQDYDSSVSDANKLLWSRGAQVAERALAHPAIAVPPPLVHSVSVPDASAARSRSITRSYNHPSTTLPPPSTHPHLSLKTKLRLTISVHLMYILALQTWVTDRDRAEWCWKEIIRVGSSATGGIGIKEGDEVVERATRRVAGIHRTEGPNEDWHLAKSKKRGRKFVDPRQEKPRAMTVAGRGPDRPRSGDAVLEMRREAEAAARARTEGSRSGNGWPNPGSSTTNGRTASPVLEDDVHSGEPASVSSAITIRGVPIRSGSTEGAGSPLSSSRTATARSIPTIESMSTSLNGGRTPRPSKFHFAADVSNEYPSPPDTPGSSPTLGADADNNLEGEQNDVAAVAPSVSSLTNTLETDEPQTYFSEAPSPSSATSTGPSFADSVASKSASSAIPFEGPTKRSHRRVISAGEASLVSTATSPAWTATSRLLTRINSSASICTLPPDFGSTTRKGKGRAVEPPIGPTNGVDVSIIMPHRASLVTDTLSDPCAIDSGKSQWNWSNLKARSGRLLGSLGGGINDGTAPSAVDALRQVLRKDEECALPAMYWGLLEEENEETEHEDELVEEQSEPRDGGEIIVGRALIVERPLFDVDPPTSAALSSASNDVERSTDFPRLSSKKGDHPIHRVKRSGAANRSFVDVTSAPDDYPSARPRLSPRHSSTNGKLRLGTEQNGSSRPSALDSPQFARLEHRSASTPNLNSGGGGDQMDPVLLELERGSRVGVRTVCSACGKKGLNFPTSRSGQTYCSRDCRVRGGGTSGQATPVEEKSSTTALPAAVGGC